MDDEYELLGDLIDDVYQAYKNFKNAQRILNIASRTSRAQEALVLKMKCQEILEDRIMRLRNGNFIIVPEGKDRANQQWSGNNQRSSRNTRKTKRR